MTGQRYVIVRYMPEDRTGYDVLPEGMSRSEAIGIFRIISGLADAKITIELAYLAMDGDDPVIDDTSLNALGFDTLVDYREIARRQGIQDTSQDVDSQAAGRRKLLSSREAATRAGFSYPYFRKLVAEGKGPAMYRFGEHFYRFDEQDVEDWIRSHYQREGSGPLPEAQPQ